MAVPIDQPPPRLPAAWSAERRGFGYHNSVGRWISLDESEIAAYRIDYVRVLAAMLMPFERQGPAKPTALNVDAFGQLMWQPYIQTRLSNAPGFTGTWYRSATVEVSADGATWYKPGTGWSTTDFYIEGEAVTGVPGLWMGIAGNPGVPGNVWRYARFTFEDRQENAVYSFRDQVWFTQLGIRHPSAPYARQYVSSLGGTIYGGLAMMGAIGGEQGDGTINATAVYDDAVLLRLATTGRSGVAPSA